MPPTTKSQQHTIHAAHSLCAALNGVALINAAACAAAGQMSLSWWHAEVRAGRAPQPVMRAPRCTRWRLEDVVTFWQRFAEQDSDPRVLAQATKASKAAKAAKAEQATAPSGA